MKKLLLLLLLSASCLGQQAAFYRAQQSQYSPNLNLDFTTGVLDTRVTYTGQNGTRVNSAGLIETVGSNVPRFEYDPASYAYTGQNLWTQSEDLSSAVWGKQDVTVTANVTTAPDGQLTADKITQSATTGRHTITRSITCTPGTIYTASIYVKAAGVTNMLLLFDSGLYTPAFGGVNFDVNAGVTAGGNATTVAGSTMTSAGNGWYRCTAKINTGSSSSLNLSFILGATTSNITGDGVNGLYYWGLQTYEGGGVFPYVATTTATIQGTRTATFNRGILVEESRTNYLNYSSDMANGAWSGFNAAVTSAGYVGKRAGVNAFRIVESSASGQSHAVYQNASTGSTNTVTASCLLRQGTRRYANVRITRNAANSYASLIVDLQSGVISQTGVTGSGDIPTMSTNVVDWGGGWWRVSITAIYSAASGTHQLGVNTANAATATLNSFGEIAYDGDGVSYIDVDAPQLEAGAFPTSWIYTLGGSVTRSQDVYYFATANWYNPNEGTIIARAYTDTPGVDLRFLQITDGTNNNRFVIQRNTTNQLGGFGISQTTPLNYGVINNVGTGPMNVAMSYRTNDYKMAANGILINGSATTSPPPVGILTATINSLGRVHVNQIRIYRFRLPNSYLQLYSN